MLAPQQVRIYPVADRHGAYGVKVRAALRKLGIRAVLVDERDTLVARLREGRRFRAPYSVVVGDNECDRELVSVSVRGVENPQLRSLESFLAQCEREREFRIV